MSDARCAPAESPIRADAVGIEVELAGFGAHELDRRLDVVNRRRIDARFASRYSMAKTA